MWTDGCKFLKERDLDSVDIFSVCQCCVAKIPYIILILDILMFTLSLRYDSPITEFAKENSDTRMVIKVF